MFRTFCKWTGLVLLLLIVGLSVAIPFRQHLTYDAPYPAITASADPAIIEQGKQLVLVTKGCASCHSAVATPDSVLQNGQEPSLAGGREIETPFGTFFLPNITPDANTGIGGMTDAELARMFRYGVKSNGEAVLPFMQGLNLNDQELTAVISYLRSVKPVENKVPENKFNLVGKFAKAFVVKPTLPQTAAGSLEKK